MKLYIYDHCPFCVKARMVFGLKNVPISLVTLANDDEKTPIALIGKKMVPILEKDDGTVMPESMDIVRYVDGLAQYGKPAISPSPSNNQSLQSWLQAVGAYTYKLAMPRWGEAALEEFKTPSAKQYFITKKESSLGSFAEHRVKSTDYKREVNRLLVSLENVIHAPDSVHKELSEDDIHLFATLRSLSIVKGLEYPQKVEAYRQTMAKKSAIPLHDAIAIA
jgi:glutaredoxin 2